MATTEKLALSRRSFLGGALAVVGAMSIPASALPSSVPIIYGNGVDDDTAGLQALMDGKPFRVRERGIYAVNRDGQIALSGGSFILSQTLIVGRGGRATIRNCNFHGREIQPDKPILYCQPSTESLWTSNYIETGHSGSVIGFDHGLHFGSLA